ncbi:Uncharacterised protein [uncultured archaeon]|nr:Uncharacterised protein [uncultured archaeon]
MVYASVLILTIQHINLFNSFIRLTNALLVGMPIEELKSKIFHWLNEPKWLNRLTLYFALGAVIIAALNIVFSYLNFLHTDVDSARYLLSALVQSEAAIVALVVTLSLVAVQLAAQSYSARVIEVFRRTPDLWILMGIYGIAIFYGLGVLKMIENPLVGRVSNLEWHIAFSYYLGVFAFAALVPYIWNTLNLLRPSTVINMLAERITTNKILAALKNEKTDGKSYFISTIDIEKDPNLPIIDIVRSALMKYDYETVRYGLRAITTRTNSIFEKEILNEEQKEKLAKLFISHLIKVGKLAACKADEYSTIEVIYNLHVYGEMAAERKFEGVLHWAVFSLGELGKEAAKQKLERATFGVVHDMTILGMKAYEQGSEDATREAAGSLKNILTIAEQQNLIKVIPQAERYYKEMNEALNKLKKKRLSEWASLP